MTGGAGGSVCQASTAAGGDEGAVGMRIFLSQIREWCIEYSFDKLFIVIRTDCAWYQIRSVAPAYAGWFAPIMKAARIAVLLLRLVTDESRSARKSFADVIKDLAAQPADAPTFLSSRADVVWCHRRPMRALAVVAAR